MFRRVPQISKKYIHQLNTRNTGIHGRQFSTFTPKGGRGDDSEWYLMVVVVIIITGFMRE